MVVFKFLGIVLKFVQTILIEFENLMRSFRNIDNQVLSTQYPNDTKQGNGVKIMIG